ncbi:MAG: hypothetical protein JSV56_00355, partial [Methanomassiliicoccales archaeon]
IYKENEELLSESYGQVYFYYFREFDEPWKGTLYLTNKRLVFVGHVINPYPIVSMRFHILYRAIADTYYATEKKFIRFAEIYHSEPFQVIKIRDGYYLYFKFKKKLCIVIVIPFNIQFKDKLQKEYARILYVKKAKPVWDKFNNILDIMFARRRLAK